MWRCALLLLAFLLPQEPFDRSFSVVAADAAAASTLALVRSEATAALATLRDDFPGLPRHGFQIVVHTDAGSLPPPIGAAHHSGSPGLALLGRHEIHVMLAEVRRSGAALRSVLAHELTHELLHQLCEPAGDRLPRWLHEGLAQAVAGDTYLGASEENIIWRVASDRLLSFSALEDDFPREPSELQLAYAQSHSFVSWLEREYGRRQLLEIVASVDQETSFLRALVVGTRSTTDELQQRWRHYLVHGSGARWRVLLEQCFSLLLILALPVLALALIRRLRADRAARARMEAAEISDDDAPPPAAG